VVRVRAVSPVNPWPIKRPRPIKWSRDIHGPGHDHRGIRRDHDGGGRDDRIATAIETTTVEAAAGVHTDRDSRARISERKTLGACRRISDGKTAQSQATY